MTRVGLANQLRHERNHLNPRLPRLPESQRDLMTVAVDFSPRIEWEKGRVAKRRSNA